MPDSSLYRGRFAPSPTGPLHLGSLIAALASYLEARQHGGQWLVRMEDLDPPREQAGAADSILQSLRDHALHWDGEVMFQSERSAAYEQALTQLQASGLLFPCQCSRQQLGPGGLHHGCCEIRGKAATALRVAVPGGAHVSFDDALQGTQDCDLYATAGDFVVRRKDGLFAYQLAVVVDDAEQGISHIVRGADLMDSTPRQFWLQQQLGYSTPSYKHLPVITHADGQKLSKQSFAPALRSEQASGNLRQALSFLQQPPPPASLDTPAALLNWAQAHWSPTALPAVTAIPEAH